MAVTIQTRRDDAQDWTDANPVLALGEIGIETDTDKAKYGDGFTAWNDLDYWIDTGSQIDPPTVEGATLRASLVDGQWQETSSIVVATDGKVGIGTTTPARLLTLKGGQNIVQTIEGPTTAGYITFTNETVTSDVVVRVGILDDALIFWNDAERMRIDPAGNVGIGTAAPSSPLHVSSAANANMLRLQDSTNAGNAAVSGITFRDSVGDSVASIGPISASNSLLYIRSHAADGIRFDTNGTTERMRIDSAGNVLVGGTSIIGPLSIMGLHQRAGQYALSFRSAEVVAGQYFYIGQTSGNAAEVVNQNGVGVRLTNGATSWTAGSDERIKNIHGHIDNAVAAIEGWRCVKYTLKEGGDKQMLGLIAQDVEPHYPEIVSHDEKGMMGLRYTELVPVLVKAIQELTARVETLENG